MKKLEQKHMKVLLGVGVLVVPAAIWFTLSVTPELTFADVAKKMGIKSNTKQASIATVNTNSGVNNKDAKLKSASGMGTNLDGIAYWTNSIVTNDLFKLSGGTDNTNNTKGILWLTQCGWDDSCGKIPQGGSSWDTTEQNQLVVDENGWVKQIPAQNDTNVGYRRVSVLVPTAASQSMPGGKYIVTYEGEGTIVYGLGGSKNVGESKPGRDIIDLPDTKDRDRLLISVTKTNPNNYIRNIKVFAPGGYCNSSETKVVWKATDCTDGSFIAFEQYNASSSLFNPAFVDKIKGFGLLRFMDLGRTNDTTVSAWTDRDQVRDAFWGAGAGMPYRAMVQLTKETNTDPWINIPTQADDSYVQGMAKVIKSAMAPRQSVYIEYGNEAWNTAFPMGMYYQNQGKAKWNPNANSDSELYDLRLNWHAYRTVQVCNLFKAAFGADANKVKCVYAGQAAVSWWLDNALKCPRAAAELGKECGRFIDVLASAPYFGNEIGGDSYYTKVANWLKEPDGGLTSLFNELNTVALPQSVGWIKADKQVADNWGIPLMAYEGGQHLVDYKQQRPQVQELFAKANRDPRMGELYTKYLTAWKDAGGQYFNTFTYTGSWSKWGYWGALESTFAVSSPKWDAIKNFSKIPCWWTCQQ